MTQRGTLVLLAMFVFIFGCVYWFFPAGAKYVVAESLSETFRSKPSQSSASPRLRDCPEHQPCPDCQCDNIRGEETECPPCPAQEPCPEQVGCAEENPFGISPAAGREGGSQAGCPACAACQECSACPECSACQECAACQECPSCPACPAAAECPHCAAPIVEPNQQAGAVFTEPRPAIDISLPELPIPHAPGPDATDLEVEKHVLALSFLDELAHTQRSSRLLKERGEGLPLCVEDCAAGYNAVGPHTPHQGRMGGVAHGERGTVCYANCCVGCSVALAYPPGTVVFLNNTYRFERGGSTAEVMRVRFHTGVKAFVKFACIPEGISGGLAKPKNTIAHTTPEQKKQCLAMQRNYVTKDTVALGRYGDMVEVSVRRLQRFCGLEDIGIESWIENVESSLPGIGVLVNQSALFTSLADGISLNPILYDTLDKEAVKRLLRSIPAGAIRKAAVHDLLFSEGDRHMGNVFLSEDGGMTLIDNDRGLGFYYDKRRRALDSVFLTNTYRNWQIFTNPIARALDYRCHVPDRKIGKSYPPQVQTCLEQLRGMAKHEVMTRFRIPRVAVAELLQSRARDMLDLGFEAALMKDLEDNGDVAAYRKIEAEAREKGVKPVFEWRTAYRPVPEPYCLMPGDPGYERQPARDEMNILEDPK